MTGRLIKFEMRSSFRHLLIVWAALMAMTILMCIIYAVSGMGSYAAFMDSTRVAEVISAIVHIAAWLVYVALMVALVVLTIAIVILRFHRGLLGDEGYLMHTLPVKEWQLITSKGVVAALAVLGSSILVAISGFMVVSTINHVSIAQIMQDILAFMHTEKLMPLLVVEGIIIAILGILKSVYQIYASLAIGQLVNRYRILLALGAYIGIGTVLSIIAMLGIFFGNLLGLDEWISNLSANVTAFEQVVMLFCFVVEAIQLVVFHIVTERIMSRKLNLL